MSAALRAKLEARAELLTTIRQFFAERNVLEVETPLLCSAPASDPHIDSFQAGERWLQSSPEYAMKRMLCDGSGAIFQLCKAFRSGEAGSKHNPEFTMLEWYQPGYLLAELITETCDLLAQVLAPRAVHSITYDELFQKHVGISSHADINTLRLAGDNAITSDKPQDWLDYLLCTKIEPQLGINQFTVVTDWPVEQAALARIVNGTAQRFEIYVDGVELANGYDELCDGAEFKRRFDEDNAQRTLLKKPSVPADLALITLMTESGLPACCGVALGVDRLLMLRQGERDIRNVICQSWKNS